VVKMSNIIPVPFPYSWATLALFPPRSFGF
jgi:hypothetical protein